MQYPDTWSSAATARPAERAEFLRKTYLHLLGAVVAFVVVEAALIQSPIAGPLVRLMLGGRLSWLLVLGAFMAVGWLAERWARSGTSVGMQYLGLGVYIVAEAIVMLPLLVMATLRTGEPNLITMAGIYTLLVFAGMTGTVFFTRKDFSWMRPLLVVASLGALGLIVVSMIFGFSLGAVFSAVMIVVASGYILYSTSNILHHYPVGSHVAASLSLFASIALLFWYILQLLSSRR